MKRREFLTTSLTSSIAFLSAHEWLRQQGSLAHSLYSYRKDYPSWKSDNIFLQGINAPVFHEVNIDQLEFTGKIPSDLEGIYLRNGPNPMFKPIAYQFPLGGDGMLHAVYFKGSSVRYRNRWIKTQGLTYEMAAGHALQELQARNYANTNIVAHAGRLLALYETGLPYEISPRLDTVGEWDFQGALPHSMSAHPRHDPETGELHFHSYSLLTEPYLTYSVANAQGEIIHQLPIELSQPTLFHDLALTAHYAIAFHCPLAFDWQRAPQGSPFIWKPDQPTRIGLIPRPGVGNDRSQEPIWLETDPFWVWHFVNAYESDQQVVIDFIAHQDVRIDTTFDSLLAQRSHLHQVVIDLSTRKVSQRSLDDQIVELPTLDERQLGSSYQFTYVVNLDPVSMAQTRMPNYFPALVQYDQMNQRSIVHRFPPGCSVGEATVVPKPGGQSEQECYVMAWVYDEQRQASDLVILDAAQFDQEPIAQIHLPVRVPMGFHGTWVPLSAVLRH